MSKNLLKQEIYSAAVWAKQQSHEHPQARIACLVPKLQHVREQVIQIFSEVLAPESLLPQSCPITPPFSVSIGQALSHFPIVSIALQGLALDPHNNPIGLISNLLNSPFLGNTGDIKNLIHNAKLDAQLHKNFETHVSMDNLPGYIIQSARIYSGTSDKLQTASLWVDQFKKQLEELGWPGKRLLSNNERQIIERFQDLLFEFSSFNPEIPLLNHVQALEYFVKKTKKTIYQPKNKETPSSPIFIQILDNLELEKINSYFNYIWIVGKGVSLIHPEISSDIFNYSNYIYQARKIEIITDTHGPQTQNQENIRGGAAILKEQAACAFQAFAKRRLHANELALPQLGLHPKERGQILHAILEQLWGDIKNHARLCELDQKEINYCINTSINKIINNFKKYKPYVFKENFIKTEKKYLFYLLQKWLIIEKSREPFKVISRELRQKIKLKYININLQIDRIDELENGNKIIIDYKTGAVKISDWLGDRPNEPQLPLYCITYPEDIDGIMLAQIRNKKMNYMGLKKEDDPDNWQELKTQWKNILLGLEKYFHEGQAIVNPKQGYQTCKKCSLHIFCRIAEKLL